MSDLELLFLVLVVIYGWECGCWVRRGSVVLRTWFGWHWRLAHPGEVFGNQRGGVILAHPLPPLGTVLTGNQYPLSLSPEAALAYVAPSINPGWRPAQTGKLVRFDDVREVQARGRAILVNGEVLLKGRVADLRRAVGPALAQAKGPGPGEAGERHRGNTGREP